MEINPRKNFPIEADVDAAQRAKVTGLNRQLCPKLIHWGRNIEKNTIVTIYYEFGTLGYKLISIKKMGEYTILIYITNITVL